MGFLTETVLEVRHAVTRPDYLDGLPSTRRYERPSLRSAMERDRGRGGVVAEFKRTSPGAPSATLPPRTVEEFERGLAAFGPTGYSCLATGPRFGGSPRDVADLAQRTDRPVLFKDIVIDPRQLEAAERSGASAVLLLARLVAFPGVALEDLARSARGRGLEVVLEFHAPDELTVADSVPADMFGVNVRDLETLRLERAVAETTLRGVDSSRPLLGMSGIASRDEARWFWDRGADAILVGSALARSSDPARLASSLVRGAPGGVA